MARSFTAASSQYAESSTPAITGYPCTLSAWFYANTTHDGQINSNRRVSGGYGAIELSVRSTGVIRYYLYGGTANTILLSATSYSTGTWTHVCGVSASATDHTLYFNGTSDDTDATDPGATFTLAKSIVGRYQSPDGAGEYFNGLLAEIGTWDVALNASEVAALADGYSPKLVRPLSLTAYWPLMGRFDPERDEFGSFPLTLVNAPTQAAHPRIIYPSKPQVIVPVSAPAGTNPKGPLSNPFAGPFGGAI